jgi:hypothetical protein
MICDNYIRPKPPRKVCLLILNSHLRILFFDFHDTMGIQLFTLRLHYLHYVRLHVRDCGSWFSDRILVHMAQRPTALQIG